MRNSSETMAAMKILGALYCAVIRKKQVRRGGYNVLLSVKLSLFYSERTTFLSRQETRNQVLWRNQLST